MTIPSKVLQIAASRIGYYAPNDPKPGSEAGRYVADLWAQYPNAAAARVDGIYNWEGGASWLRGPSNEIWWCCLFVSMCYCMAGGRRMPGIPNYNCDNLKTKAWGYVLKNKYDAKPGDFVLYDWSGDGSCDHIGICELNLGSYIQCIEGNTSSGNAGSQSAGNGVWRRTRAWGSVNCVIRPVYGEDDDEMPLTDSDIQKIWNYGGAYSALENLNANISDLAKKISIDVPVAYGSAEMRRMFNPTNGLHKWVSNAGEIENLKRLGWKDEGASFSIPINSPIYALQNDASGDFLLTASQNEADTLNDNGWSCLGIVGASVEPSQGVPVYRLFDGASHLFTVDAGERNALVSELNYKDEGIAFYAYKLA